MRLTTNWGFAKLRFKMLQGLSKWKAVIQNGRLKFKHAAMIICKILQCHATRRGLFSKCRRNHAKWEVLSSSQRRLTLQNAENIVHTSTTQTPFFVFLHWFWRLLFPLDFAKFWQSVSWLHDLHGFWRSVHCNQTKHNEIANTAYTQIKTTPSAVGVFLQLHQPITNRQQPTTNNGLQIARQMQDSSSKMLQIARKMKDMKGSNSKMMQIARKTGTARNPEKESY